MKERYAGYFEKLCEYSLYGLIFFIPISKAGIEACFTLAIFCYYARKILKPEFKFLRHPANFFFLLFVIFNYLSLINSGKYFSESFKNIFFKWSEYFLLFLMAQDLFSDHFKIKRAIKVFLFVALLLGVDGIWQRLIGVDFIRQRNLIDLTNGFFGITASFQHYNDFGSYLVFLLSFIIALLLTKRNYQEILYFLLISLVACLLFTFSRGSWLGLAASLLMMVSLSVKRRKFYHLALIFVILVFLTPGIKQRLLFSFGPAGDADRLEVWKGTWQMIMENPFLGKGIGTYMIYFSNYMPERIIVQYAHNCYLQIWAETGFFSLLSFLLFIGAVIYRGIMAFKKSSDPIVLGLVCGIFGFLVHSFFDTQFYSLQLATLFWLSAGLLVAQSRVSTPRLE